MYRKEIVYDRATRDYAMYLDGELVGFARTYQEAESTLDQLVYELLNGAYFASADVVDEYRATAAETADQEAEAVLTNIEPATPPTPKYITIKEPGLVERSMFVRSYSTAELVKHEPLDSANVWYALLVDGVHYNLVMWKHTIGRPQHMEALNRALATVQAAIADQQADQEAVRPALDPTEADSTGFTGGVHALDPDALQVAAEAALAHPALQASRWQTALRKALTHLLGEWRSGFRGDGAYFWQPDEPDGGMYAATPATCQCVAYAKEKPCRHRAAAIILNLYHQAIVETEQVAA